jgi:hypothetical protein
MHADNDLYQPDDGSAVTVAKEAAVIKQRWHTLVAT